MTAVRRAAVDGLFYPAAPSALRQQVERCLGEAADDHHRRAGGPPKLLIAPHAGYAYSGAVAAAAYALLGR
ncbi:MAG TPA: AmmeMemoRadiSam system protein B, partial [Variovorax sp.]|nr:AmmeMemoRadiSam system protein B [Variovorax sp.]